MREWLGKFFSSIRRKTSKDMKEESVILVSVFRWILIASVVGAAVGFLTALFLKALGAAIGYTGRFELYFIIIPFALAINVLFLKYVLPRADPPSTDIVIGHIHAGKRIHWTSAIKAFFAPILTIASGGSVGKEAPAADMGAAVGTSIGELLRLDPEDIRKLAICGISAGFSAVFGTPIAGAIFGVEILFVGSILYEVLLPSFVAGIVGYAVAASMGAPFFYHPIAVVPPLTEGFFLQVVLAGVFFGLCAFLLVEVLRFSQRMARSIPMRKVYIAFLGGTLIVLLAFATSSRYLGLGIGTIEETVAGVPVHWYDFLLKMVFTGLTIAFGGSGGLVTPILFVGSTAGAAFAQLFTLDVATFAAIGTVAVLAGATNAPIAASVLAIELFGPAIAPYAALAVIISFLMTGHRSVYPSQVMTIQKATPKDEALHGRITAAARKPGTQVARVQKRVRRGIAKQMEKMRKK